MAVDKRLDVYSLFMGLLDVMEIEAQNELRDAVEFSRIDSSDYTTGRLRGCRNCLSTLREIRHRIPKSFKKALVEYTS